MKKKPVIIIVCVLLLAACAFIFIQSKYLRKPEKQEVIVFLEHFKADLQKGDADTLLNYFDGKQNTKQFTRLLNMLSNKTGENKAPFTVALLTDSSEIKVINSELTEVKIPVNFNENGTLLKQTIVLLKLRKITAGQFKIAQIDARQFANDFVLCESLIRTRNMRPEDLYSPRTLAAFKIADRLKSKYDSVAWFQFVDKKIFFYVIKGKWGGMYWWDDASRKEKFVYGMGLVGNDNKEIIPPVYDLVHNIGGTIKGLIEVEKGKKKGLYNTEGKMIAPVEYDQILPLADGENLALLNTNGDSFYLTKALTISNKLDTIKMSDVFKRIKDYGKSYKVGENTSKDIMEFNDKLTYTQLIVSPSYLVEWNILPQFMELPNKQRQEVDNGSGEGQGSEWYKISFDGHKSSDSNWFESAFYSVINNYLGSRASLYETKSLLLLDKKSNKILGFNTSSYFGMGEGGGALSGKCNDNYFRQINDTLFEYKTTSQLEIYIPGDTITEGPYYHYLHIKDGKLLALPNNRKFGFTKYVKMDDSYLTGCFVINGHTVEQATPTVLQYFKNEIFASYNFNFKTPKWLATFQYLHGDEKGKNANVDDSLTVIDKYNINFINQKLKGQKPAALASVK